MSQAVVNLNVAQFDGATEQGVVLVDFWAPWCGPCRMQGPILESLAGGLNGSAVIAKVDVDQNPELAARFSVQGIPTMVLLKDGQEVARFVGVQSEENLKAAIAAQG